MQMMIPRWVKEYIDHDGCKFERPTKKGKIDDEDEDKRSATDRRSQSPRFANRDKNYLEEINTIIGGPLALSQLRISLVSGSSRGKQVMNLEPKRLKVDNTILFSEKDYEGVQAPY